MKISGLELPADLRRKFLLEGYVALPGFLRPNDVEVLLDNVRQFIQAVVPNMPREHVFYEDRERPETLKQLQAMHLYHDYFAGLFAGSQFEQLASKLLGDEVVGQNLQFFNKPPGVGQPTPAHQDGYYFMLAPCEAVTMLLALDVVDEENGCVRYVQSSHQKGMRPHGRTQVLGFSQGIIDYPRAEDLAKEVSMPAKPGDLLVHHALTIHRADANRSTNRSRRALGFIYYAQRAKEDIAAKQAYQARLADEMKTAGKI